MDAIPAMPIPMAAIPIASAVAKIPRFIMILLFALLFNRLQNPSERGTGRFLKKAPQKLLEWVWLDIVTAIPCATIYRNCKTPEIVERAPGGFYPSRRSRFSSAWFRFFGVLQSAIYRTAMEELEDLCFLDTHHLRQST